MLSMVEAQLWKITTGVAAMAAIALCVALGIAQFRLHEAFRARDAAQTKIDDPRTGYAMRLATCHSNLAQANAAIASQNASMTALHEDGEKRLAEARAGLERAGLNAAHVDARIKRILEPVSDKVSCNALEEIDRRARGEN